MAEFTNRSGLITGAGKGVGRVTTPCSAPPVTCTDTKTRT
jgi:hypothetical protein